MQGLFETYLELGFRHILDIRGYDHMVFLVALCALYTFREWKSVVVLVTAFTIGHSLTLALAALGWIRFPQPVIEFLIPTTIFMTAVFNLFRGIPRQSSEAFAFPARYIAALFFGLIHGMGFSNFFRAAVLPGEESNFLLQLFAFNLGVELGQILVVAGILLLAAFFLRVVQMPRKAWVFAVSGIAGITAILLMVETRFW